MTLLSIVECTADIIGLPRPTTVVTNTDQTVRTMFALLNREGQNLAKLRNGWGGGWSVLEKQHSFSTVAAQDEYALPTDYGEMISDTVWNQDTFWEVRGPLSPQQWQTVKSGLASSPALRFRFRIKRSATSGEKVFVLDPVPTAVETVVFEYLTNRWASDTGGTTFATKFSADSDVSLLDEDLLEMGLEWRFKAAKGLGFAAELAEYEIERDRRMANDGGTTSILIARPRFRLPPGNIAETGFG